MNEEMVREEGGRDGRLGPTFDQQTRAKSKERLPVQKQAGGGNLPGNRRECGVCRKNSSDLAARRCGQSVKQARDYRVLSQRLQMMAGFKPPLGALTPSKPHTDPKGEPGCYVGAPKNKQAAKEASRSG